MRKKITKSNLIQFRTVLIEEEKAKSTIEKYIKAVKLFADFVGNSEISKQIVVEFKSRILQEYSATSCNIILTAVNRFLDIIGRSDCKVKQLKIQNNSFLAPERELTYDEYLRLVQAAQKRKNITLSLVLQTICSIGIRVSELQFVTLESLQRRFARIQNKGKFRDVPIPRQLVKLLKTYADERGITAGAIFVTKGGKPLNRTNIWRQMKSLCAEAGVLPSKVFPHNLRHLFAVTYYNKEKDLSGLAKILGHSSVTTTLIYTNRTLNVALRKMERLKLIVTTEYSLRCMD